MTLAEPAENEPVELLLQALISIVDAQLLKAVIQEALKAVDIQDGQAGAGDLLAHRQKGIDTRHQPSEQGCIDRLG